MRDRKRLFIAIEISKEARDFLKDFRNRWYDFPGKWTDTDKLHITLSFLGNVREEDIPNLIEAISNTASLHSPFSLTIEKITFDTDILVGKKFPKMIWAKVGESENLEKLYREMSDMLEQLPIQLHSQRSSFSAHITLCRFNSISLRKWHGEQLPDIKEEVHISFPVAQIHLMESKLRRGGPEYFVLQSFALGA